MKTILYLNEFVNYKDFDQIYDEVINWNMSERIDLKYIDYKDFVKTYLNLTEKQYKFYEEDIQSDVNRACLEALETDYCNELIEYIKSKIKAYLTVNNTWIKDVKFGNKESTETNSGYITTIEIEYLQKDFIAYLKQDNRKLEDVYIEDEIDKRKIDLEYFDHYGSVGNCDNWQQNFKDYNETEYLIKKNRAKKQNKLKSLIQNNVNLIYRKNLLPTF